VTSADPGLGRHPLTAAPSGQSLLKGPQRHPGAGSTSPWLRGTSPSAQSSSPPTSPWRRLPQYRADSRRGAPSWAGPEFQRGVRSQGSLRGATTVVAGRAVASVSSAPPPASASRSARGRPWTLGRPHWGFGVQASATASHSPAYGRRRGWPARSGTARRAHGRTPGAVDRRGRQV